jgi:4-amino-4-deoxy-L-arabinose transferase-like glycosyltransferase
VNDPHTDPRPSFARTPILPIALVALGIHALPQPGFGFQRDELLYFAMGDHLDLFRMQFPPLIAAAARLMKAVFGDHVAGARLLPALLHAVLIVLAAAMARVMGGTARAQLLAGLALLVAPVFMRAGTLFQPVVFELTWSSLALLALLELLARPAEAVPARAGWWCVLGIALGLGAMTKFSIAFLLMGVGVAVILSPLRRDLLTRWPWTAALIVAALAVPSLRGQATWQWPFLAQMAALRESQLQRVTPGAFLSAQPLMLGPAAVLMLAGAWSLMFGTLARRFRPAAYAGVAVLVVLLILHGKDYYFAPVHPLLMAAGSVALARTSERKGRAWTVPAMAAWLMVGGALLLPMGAPILPREALARYAARLGVSRAVATNYGTVLPLPQDFADMIGWEELAATVAAAYRSLPDAERAHTVIVGGNYGRAGALAIYARRYELPYPVSRSGDFYNWGLPPQPISTLLIVGGTIADLQPLCGSVTEVARTSNPWGVEEEQAVPIHLCRDLLQPPAVIWRRLGPDWG